MDAVDAALVDFAKPSPQLIAAHKSDLSDELRRDLTSLCETDSPNIAQLAELDLRLAHEFAGAVKKLLEKTSFSKNDILAIGSHGQTIFHYPQHPYPFTVQIGDPNSIAEKTGITTIADFRRRDIAAGGQGAPLTPAFHNFIFRNEKEDRIVLNLGGIANITYLPADVSASVMGFDTGPANLLLDKWIQKQSQPKQWFDKDGKWAASADFNTGLLEQFLSDPYFHCPPPKSTGHDDFNLAWLEQHLTVYSQQRGFQQVLRNDNLAENSSAKRILTKELSPAIIQATLCELTAVSIGSAMQQFDSKEGTLVLCGGGSKNTYLRERLKHHCQTHQIALSDDLGVPSEWMEAMAFAWFAKQTLEGKTSNLPEVTGAKNPTILGGIYLKA